MIDEQFEELAQQCKKLGCGTPKRTDLPSSGVLIEIPGVKVEGWNRPSADILFLAPPGYPASQPDCFWIQPSGFRLADGGTPQNTSDSNGIPDDISGERNTTWFSWHIERWNPNQDTLCTYFRVILNRLSPAR